MKRIIEIPLVYDPGTKWSYSSAVDVQGYLVEKISGKKLGDYLNARVFSPLGMAIRRSSSGRTRSRASPMSIIGSREGW